MDSHPRMSILQNRTKNNLRGLDFFVGCESICQQIRDHVSRSQGETATASLQQGVLRDIEFLHNMPMQTLNDRLKKYPFVDPQPFDWLLTEILTAVLEWLQWITNPLWIVEVAHCVGDATKDSENNDSDNGQRFSPVSNMSGLMSAQKKARGANQDGIDEAIELGKFSYPMPLKLRDLQMMIRPFMETRSHHHILGLDAIVSELIRGLLRLYHTVKGWDEALVGHIDNLAHANLEDESKRIVAICELCACMEMDVFEASHRLHHIDREKFNISPSSLEVICQKLPLFQDQWILKGPPIGGPGNGGFSLDMFEKGVRKHARDLMSDDHYRSSSRHNNGGSWSPWQEVRAEALMWWRQQHFTGGVQTRILASALLTYLADHGLHSDPHMAEMLPRVLQTLFNVSISCKAFMNKLLLLLGGYTDTDGVQVQRGYGLPLKSNVPRCAESLLVFMRQWSEDLEHHRFASIIAAGEKSMEKRVSARSQSVKRASEFNLEQFLEHISGPKHSVREVIDMLEGATPIPDSVLNVKADDRRYRIDEKTERAWELKVELHNDLLEVLDEHHRDLGPYVHIDFEQPETLQTLSGGKAQEGTIINPELAAAARKEYSMEDSDSDSDVEIPQDRSKPMKLSDVFGLRLAQFPPKVGAGESSKSTFVRFFSKGGRLISRRHMNGLPPLPWSFGSDERNTIIIDMPGADDGLAPFHCLFTQSKAQPMRGTITPMGGTMAPTYIVCPKYQPIQVQNGDRLVCHQWNFELRIVPTGLHMSTLLLLTDEGDSFEVPTDGCHVGAGNRSRQLPNQPSFPLTKFALKHRLKDMAAVHMAFNYHAPTNRWTLVDHSPEPLGTLLLLKTGTAYPLSHGLRLKLGPVILETVIT
mmetsp:Transcript_90995/g.167082  ORF Transcript_90995/g.167082 Transcript_90995/m.167082 type:complete len:871 (+) Transcript_90995:70-2682(+)